MPERPAGRRSGRRRPAVARNRWLLTALSFAIVIGISIYYMIDWWRSGGELTLPLRAHLLAIAAVTTEIITRSLKISWGSHAVGIRLPFLTAMRTTLAGDFGGSLTPARTGSEPARFLVLAEAGVPATSALLVLYVELFLEMLSLTAVLLIVAFVFREEGALVAGIGGLVAVYTTAILGIAAIARWLARRQHREEPPPWAASVRLSPRRWALIEGWFARVRETVEHVNEVDSRWAVASFLASVVHVAMRLCVLPALVLGAGGTAPIGPLALWPLALLYGTAIVPMPAGGGTVELTFKAALEGVIGPRHFGAALIWWRFYTFYIYIVLGAIAAGRTAMRALRQTDEMEEELVRVR